jgi:hypothetical protein
MRRHILRLFITAAAIPFAGTSAVVARYTFEEGQNGSAAINAVSDSSGNRFDGVPINRPVYTSVNQPNSSRGLRFNGSQRVLVPHRPLLELHKSFAIEASIFIEACPAIGVHSQIVYQGDNRDGNDPIALTVEANCTIRMEVMDDEPA